MSHHHTAFRPSMPPGHGLPPAPSLSGMTPQPEFQPHAMGGGGQAPVVPMPTGIGPQPAVADKTGLPQPVDPAFTRAATMAPALTVDDRASSSATLQSSGSLPVGMGVVPPRKSRNPRVVHRHLYLWIEDQIERNKAVPGLMVIESLETFYREVLDANEGNEQFNFEKLLELAQKQPPVSLLYDRTLNTSTNVLKRWNNTNGMLNWFLHKIGRNSTPDAVEVVQLARVHVARSVMKKHRTAIIPLSHAGGSASDLLLGKRKSMDGRPVGGLCHVEGQNKKQLYENLKAMYPGVKKQSVFDAVDEEAWMFHAEGSYAPNPVKLHSWSEMNGLWQHFAAYCRVENIKHDTGLFGGEEGQPKGNGGGGGNGGGAPNKKMAMSSGNSTGGGFPGAVKGSFPANNRPGSVKSGDSVGSGSGGGGGVARPDQRKPGLEGGDPAAQMMMNRGFSASRVPYADYFESTMAAFEVHLRNKIEACSSENIPIRYVDSRRYEWDHTVMEDWGRRWVELGQPDLTILMPYVVLIRRGENGERDDPNFRALTQRGSQTDVRQVGVYTFKYGSGYYLHVTISLVCFNREARKARFTGKYILSNADDVLLPCDCGPVSIDPSGTIDAQPISPEEYVENQGMYYLSGGVSAAQEEGYTELRDKTQSLKIPISLVELLTASDGAGGTAAAAAAASGGGGLPPVPGVELPQPEQPVIPVSGVPTAPIMNMSTTRI